MRLPASIGPDASDPYAALGLEPSATAAEVKAAYFSLVRAHPPERDPERFKEIRAAYERLNTTEKRLETDMLRLQPWAEPELPGAEPPSLAVASEDVIRAARAVSELTRTDWREDFREVRL